MTTASKALEINLADHRVKVTVDPKYLVLGEVMSKYFGLRAGVDAFVEELCHPYRNWEFILREARGYALNYFHLTRLHPKGPEVADLYLSIFTQALAAGRSEPVRVDAADNLLLFAERILEHSQEHFTGFLPVLKRLFDAVAGMPEDRLDFVVKSYYPVQRIAGIFSEKVTRLDDLVPLNRLLSRCLDHTYSCWLEEDDPGLWFEKEGGAEGFQRAGHLFEPVSHDRWRRCRQELSRITACRDADARSRSRRLLALPGHKEIIELCRRLPHQLLLAGGPEGAGPKWKLLFLFYTMGTSSLGSIHEESLREINHTVAWCIDHKDTAEIEELLEKTFSILTWCLERFAGTTLHAVLNLGRGVYRTNDSDLVDFFTKRVVALGFEPPRITGVGNDWQVVSNRVHIQNIRTWMELAEVKPKWSKRLLSSLIIHLAVSGVFIKDTELFPKDVTRFLNSDIGPVYNLAKQLTRLFPVYFNEIGAEGRLRDVSTELDEITARKDLLLHFLRKQSHVESSNLTVHFMEATLRFWKEKDKSFLEPFLPTHIHEDVREQGPYVDGVHDALTHLMGAHGTQHVQGLLDLSERQVTQTLTGCREATETDRRRVALAVTFYRLLYDKYHTRSTWLESYLGQFQADAFPKVDLLKAALAAPEHEKLPRLLDYLETLKCLILSSRTWEIKENIYRKRHFTVDIPSMYGSYHEKKFDALGLTFRIEALVNVLFEKLVAETDLKLITRATFIRIHQHLCLFERALQIDGIASLEMQGYLDLLGRALTRRGFTFTQYIDIFKGLAIAVRNVVNDYFHNIHEENLTSILPRIRARDYLPKYLPAVGRLDGERLFHRVFEVFFRDRISASLGLQQLDTYLSRILNTLYQQADRLPSRRLHLLLNYDPQRALVRMEKEGTECRDIILVGNKGLNLIRLQDMGIPVPPGFIITTEVFRCSEVFGDYKPAFRDFKEKVAVEIARLEEQTGRQFGNPHNPLLLSVRSGSSISQPGMMDTFLNVGISETIAEAVAARTGKDWFVWDNYRRFLQTYGMSYGLKRDDFDRLIDDFKRRFGARKKHDLSGARMKELALMYKEMLLANGVRLEESPLEQFHLTIRRVWRSWYSDKAHAYRKIMGISDDWGTAVTVQSMVFGNIGHDSGAGVFFTHDPRWPGDMLRLWGDYTVGNQGEDVVAGLVETLPISRIQAQTENREAQGSLEARFPRIYRLLRDWAKDVVYDKGWGPQEMEFTFEGPDEGSLYVLQARDMVMRARERVPSFIRPESIRPLGHGIGVSGGAMSGKAVFTLEEMQDLRQSDPGVPLILVRGDTVPDDIQEINEADGLLTGRGGATSHAAVVAHRLGKTCVVGCADLICRERERVCWLAGHRLGSADWISIDGREGSIFGEKLELAPVDGP